VKITIIRNKGFFGRLRRAKILADDTEIGQLRAGQQVTVQVPPKAKNLYVKMDWALSLPYSLAEVKEGQIIYMNAYLSWHIGRGLGLLPIPIRLEDKPG
jgi:hypothetical protein